MLVARRWRPSRGERGLVVPVHLSRSRVGSHTPVVLRWLPRRRRRRRWRRRFLGRRRWNEERVVPRRRARLAVEPVRLPGLRVVHGLPVTLFAFGAAGWRGNRGSRWRLRGCRGWGRWRGRGRRGRLARRGRSRSCATPLRGHVDCAEALAAGRSRGSSLDSGRLRRAFDGGREAFGAALGRGKLHGAHGRIRGLHLAPLLGGAHSGLWRFGRRSSGALRAGRVGRGLPIRGRRPAREHRVLLGRGRHPARGAGLSTNTAVNTRCKRRAHRHDAPRARAGRPHASTCRATHRGMRRRPLSLLRQLCRRPRLPSPRSAATLRLHSCLTRTRRATTGA